MTDTVLNPAILNRDYVLLVDKSGSMSTPDVDGKSRWDAIKEASVAVARKLDEIDPDGIVFGLFSGTPQRFPNAKPDKIERLFKEQEPGGSTALHLALAAELDDYLQRKAQGKTHANGEAIFVVTDGAPDNREKVAQVIVNTTKRLTSPNELNITFIQVGKDSAATEFLNRLDDDLEKEGAKYDIVDTITLEAMGSKPFTQVLIDAVTEHKQH